MTYSQIYVYYILILRLGSGEVLVSDFPPEAISLLNQFMAGTLDTYVFMPLILNLRKRVDRPIKMTL